MSRATPIAGKYVPIRPLAAGGMAEVELARQIGIDGFQKLVVLKRIRPEYANNAEFVTRFLDEARTVADLRHPNIVQIYDAGCDEGGFWLAMAFVHGAPVRKLWRDAEQKKERVPIEHVLHVIVGAARGLHYAHEKEDSQGRPLGIVHRDVSPQNLLVSFQGEVKVADFGIARADNQQHVTRAGHVWGKLDYMAPEQARGGSVTPASDQFALGIVAWELATGERLFRRDSDAETLRAVLTCSVPSIASRVPGFPPPIERVIAKALEPDIPARHASCAAFAAELEAAAARVPLVLSDGRLGAFLRDQYPEESKELTLGNRIVKDAAPSASATGVALDRRRVIAGVAVGALALSAGGWWWKTAAPRRLRETEALVAAGREDDALESALRLLVEDPTNARLREIVKDMGRRIADNRSKQDPKAARRWAVDLVARHPHAADVLRGPLRVVEVRELIAESNLRSKMAPVADYVTRTLDTPEVALAAAHTYRRMGLDAGTYVWMFSAALDGGMPKEPVMFEAAMEVLTERLPHAEATAAARRIAYKVDDLGYQEWVTRTQYNGTGYALMNAVQEGIPMDRHIHLEALDDVITSQTLDREKRDGLIRDLVVGVSRPEQKRMADALRIAVKDDDLPVMNREAALRALDVIDGKLPVPPDD